MEEIKTLVDKESLEKRIKELADKIDEEYKDKEIVLIGILKGSIMFMTELAKNIKNNIYMDFMEVSSYEGTESTGRVKINKDIRNSIEGKDVIIVEDIVDTGRTLTYLLEYLKNKKANSIKIMTMLSKPSRRVVDINVDYVGFEIEDKFVVGYGLDYNEKYRNLPYIGFLSNKVEKSRYSVI